MAAMSLRGALTWRYRRVVNALPRPARFALDGAEAAALGSPNLIRHLDLTAGIVRRRLWPQRLFVGWLLHGDENDGAARVHALLPHAFLRGRGVNSILLRKPCQIWAPYRIRAEDIDRVVRAGFDAVVFQGVYGPDAEALALALKGTSTKTVYVAGDLVKQGMPRVVDWVVVASDGLKGIAPGHFEKTSVIASVIDAPTRLVKDYSRPPERDEIRVVWVGYPENLHLLAPVREALKDPRLTRFRLITITRGPGATIQWDRKQVWRHLLACDVAVLPSAQTDWYQAKPNTRMTMLKSLGLPIVASPIPSYRETLSHGASCFFARTAAEWADCLAALADFTCRRRIGLADRQRILATYGIQAVGGQWLSLFEQLAGPRRAPRAQPCRRPEAGTLDGLSRPASGGG